MRQHILIGGFGGMMVNPAQRANPEPCTNTIRLVHLGVGWWAWPNTQTLGHAPTQRVWIILAQDRGARPTRKP